MRSAVLGFARRLPGPFIWLVLAGVALSAEIAPPRATVALDEANVLVLGPTRPLVLRLHVTINGKPFREVWHERLDELFDQEDRDRDGRITVEQGDEIARDMNGGLRDTPRSVARDSLLRSMAAADGTVDRGTLATYIQQILPPFALHRRPVISQGSGLALFPLLDTDGDQRLSESELAAAEGQAIQRDFNDDGVVTAFELLLDPNAIAAASDEAAAQRDAEMQDKPALLLDESTPDSAIVDTLMKRYDHNADGRINTAAAEREIDLPASVLKRLDADSDGALDRDELAGFAARPPDLELNIALGTVTAADRRRNRQRVRVEPEWRARRKLDGGYDLSLGDMDVDFKRNNRNPQQADIYNFSTFDSDDNEYVDDRESLAGGIGRSAWEAMDIDEDKKVYKGEFTSFLDRQTAAAAVRVQLEVSDLGQDLFAILDIDMDGTLSPRELRTARNVLAIEDRNGDGTLGGDEIPLRLIFEIVRGADPPSEEEARLARGRIARSTARANTTGPLWYRKMDRNNDGDLSVQEFVGPLETFRKLDADGDALIDRDEAEAAGK